MSMLAFAHVLAQLPTSTIYIHPAKLLAFIALFIGWILFAQWLDKDAIRVNTFRSIWNMVSLICGAVGLLLLLLLPIFLAAIAAYIVVMATFMIVYVVHRNGLVNEEDKVCTAAHIQRLMKEGFSSKKGEKKIDVAERVRIKDARDQLVPVPETNEERQVFAAAQDLLYGALFRHANGVEVIPAGQAAKVRLIVDGLPTEREPLERSLADRVVGFLKGVAGLNLEERRKPQRGQINATIADHKYDVVVRTAGSTAGEQLKLRIIGDEARYKVDDVGLTSEQKEITRELIHSEHGLILITAPPKEGLTTTIYSFARSNDAFLQNIQTLEYELEIEIENITRHVYKPRDDKPFSEELRRVVRTDPDVIVLPEIRDKTTAIVASEAAVGKPTVYVGVTASDLFDGLRKWVASVNDPKLICKSLRAVFHQRLVRKLCPSCKAPYKPDPATMKKISAPKDQVLYRPAEPQVDKHGNPIVCQHCHGAGYVGRTGVFSILRFDDDLRKVLLQGGSLADLKAAAAQKGGLSIQQMALQKVFDGVTSIEEVVRATRTPAARKPPSAAAKQAG